MKFSSIVVLATGALAAKPVFMEPTLVKRASISQVAADVNTISASATALDSAIKSFSGVNDAQALISASQAIVSAIKQATSDSSGIADNSLGYTDAVPLVNPIDNLKTIVQTTVSDLTGKKSQFASLGLCGAVLEQVQAQQSAANTFQTTIISKLNSEAKPIGQQLAGPIIASLNSAASAFQSCPASSSSPSTGTTTSTTSGTTSTGTGTTVTSTGVTTSTGSFVSTVTSTSTPTGNGTVPTSPTPTVIGSSPNAGAKQVAGFGGIIAAALLAVAAF